MKSPPQSEEAEGTNDEPSTALRPKKPFTFPRGWFANVAEISNMHYAMMCDESSDDPITIEDIRHRRDAEKWREAMVDEIKSLSSNETWDLVEMPTGARVVQSKGIFKTKRDVDGNVVRYKARLVARGFT